MKRIAILTFTLACLTFSPSAFADETGQLYAQSYTYEAQGDYTTALKTLQKIPSSQRSTYVYVLRHGWLLYLNGRYEDSIKSYERAVNAAPKAIEPLLGQMLPQMALRRWVDVQATGRKAMALDADNYLATSRTAYAMYQAGRFAEAAKYYQRLVDLYPSDVEMKAGLGWALLKQGKKSQAHPLFAEVLAVAPAHQSALAGAAEAK